MLEIFFQKYIEMLIFWRRYESVPFSSINWFHAKWMVNNDFWKMINWRNEWRFSGPCTPNKIFFDADGTNGMCRCRERNHLLWKTDERCYRVFAKVSSSFKCYLITSFNQFQTLKSSLWIWFFYLKVKIGNFITQ